MTAQEMFEKLGYVVVQTTSENNEIIEIKYEKLGLYPECIIFCMSSKSLLIKRKDTVTLNEFIAITQQYKEFGWLDG